FFHSYPAATLTKSISTSNLDFLKALVVIYFPFAGFEICVIPAEETKGEQKTAYRSMKIVMIIVTFIYILLNVSLIGALGSKALANSPAPLATASGLILKQSSVIVSIIGIVAMLSAINAYMFAASRVLQNTSSLFKNNYLNVLKGLGSSGTPERAIILITFVSCILLILFSNSFETLADISVIMTLIPYSFVCLSAYKLFPGNKITKIISISGATSTFAIVAIYIIFQIL
ncbi:MAG TPA: amino acid permease, partial [Candidatus Nitrosocosmicus sp.]|nr:amino acid permease [Candidatus Nitrosocosmicus sp.]